MGRRKKAKTESKLIHFSNEYHNSLKGQKKTKLN